MKNVFKGLSLKKCINDACRQFNIDEKDLEYKVIDEKEGIFIKWVSIEAWPKEELKNDLNEKNIETKEKSDMEEEIYDSYVTTKENDGTVEIKDGKVIVTNPKEEGKPACILVPSDICLLVDGEAVKGKVYVYENSNIEFRYEEENPKRQMDIIISNDAMEAYMSIKYIPENIYRLEDCPKRNTIEIDKTLCSQKFPPKYTVEEVEENLCSKGIIYGIIKENIAEVIECGCSQTLVAKGDMPKDGTDDEIEYRFAVDNSLKKLAEDSNGNIDFKSIGAVESVAKGSVIAVRHKGEIGIDGKDIKGKTKKCEKGKRLKLKVGDGCALQGDNTVIATTEGKPCVKSDVFYVYKVHELREDVDVATGNVKFIGDIIIHGSVKEGMEVLAGNSIVIDKNVERAYIKGTGHISIGGKILASRIVGGGEDVGKLNFIENLVKLRDMVSQLKKAVNEIKKFDLLGENKKDGEIIKALIESKFKLLPRTCLSIIRDIAILGNDDEEQVIASIIKNKLIGLAPINIKNYKELETVVDVLDNRILEIKRELDLPVTVKIDYCQDSKINSSGDIIITGKGEYVSFISANGSVYFTQSGSLARGGKIRAKKDIKCKVVGSSSGVTTKLIALEEKGHIWADVAYQNTIFKIGHREFLLEVPSRNVHAYIDKQGEITVDKLNL